MALQIKETPVLKGQDAKKFEQNANDAYENPVPYEEYERALLLFSEMMEKQGQNP